MSSLINFLKVFFKRKSFLDLSFSLLIIIFTWNVSKRFMNTGLSHDESALVFGGHGMLHGMVPYRDFFELKPIMAIVMNALGILFFGLKNCGFKYIVTVSLVISLILFYFSMLKLKIFRFFAFIISIFTSYLLLQTDFHDWGNNDYEIYGAIFSILSFSSLYLIDKTVKDIKLSHFFAGLFFAMAVLTKEPYLFTLIAFTPFAFFEEKPLKFNLIKFKSLSFGFISFIAFFFIYLLLNGALGYYMDRMDYALTYAKEFHNIAVERIPSGFKEVMLYDWNKIRNYLHNFSSFQILLPFYISILIFNKFNFKTVLCIAGIIGGMAGISASHTFWKHNFTIGMFSFVLPSVLGARVLSLYFLKSLNPNNVFKSNQHIIIRLIIVNLVLLYFLNNTIVNYYKASPQHSSSHQLDEVLDGSFTTKALPVINKFTTTNDKVLFIGDAVMYTVANRKPVSRLVYATDNFFKISSKKTNLQSLLEDIKREKPKLIYIQFGFPHTVDLIRQTFIPYIREEHYFNCGNGVYLRDKPSDSDKNVYCEFSFENFFTSEKNVRIKSASASSEHSSEWAVHNAFDNNLDSDWAVKGHGNENVTILLNQPEKLKSIYLYSRKPYVSYQSWENLNVKFYLNGSLVTSRYFNLPDVNKKRFQEINFSNILSDKVEIYVSKANNKTPEEEIASHPIDSGYTEILLIRE